MDDLNPLSKFEKYKIFEYFEYSLIEPNNGIYDHCIIFFAGFNENASKYIYLLKLFLEKFQPFLKIKLIIPMLNRYHREEYKKAFIPRSGFDYIYSWFMVLKDESKPSGYSVKTNTEKDNLIMTLINDEINKLGNSNKIIFVGFSMGGRYLLHILTLMKIKTLFNLIFKTVVFLYENPYLLNNSENDNNFSKNNFHLYYSRYDKIVQFQNIGNSFQIVKKAFENSTIRLDNNKKHIVDYNCLEYFKKLLMHYLFQKEKF